MCERDGLTTFKRIETVIASERQRLKEQSVCVLEKEREEGLYG